MLKLKFSENELRVLIRSAKREYENLQGILGDHKRNFNYELEQIIRLGEFLDFDAIEINRTYNRLCQMHAQVRFLFLIFHR